MYPAVFCCDLLPCYRDAGRFGYGYILDDEGAAHCPKCSFNLGEVGAVVGV